jgi:AraC-like DNA-binding protein
MGDDVSMAGRLVWSSSDVAAAEAFDYWADVICDAFVQVSARPTSRRPFVGRIEHVDVSAVGFTAVSSGPQSVERTRGQIARGGEDYVLASIQVDGWGQVRQDGRIATLSAGAMTFVDSTRPYSMHFTDAFSQVVVRVPRSLAPRSLVDATAVELTPDGPGRLVADFLVGLRRLEPDAAALLVPHAVGLLDSALGWAAAKPVSNLAVTRERIHRFVYSHASDPDLDVATVAAACGISRRTLFRALADEPLGTLLRRLRVNRAQQLLLAAPRRSLAMVAHDSGFGGEAQLHRAFRAVTGTTPAAYRDGVDRQQGRH